MIKINELFLSLQGETDRVGLPTVFVRLSGCPLRCHWCDTKYAFNEGELLSISDIVQQVSNYDTKFVTLTGGEPLAQKDSLTLLCILADRGFDVSLETGGMLDISAVDKRICIILDIKTPSSGEVSKNLWSNLNIIKPNDQIKFVIGSLEDYHWSKQQLSRIKNHPTILFSPVTNMINPVDLAQWILNDRLKVRFQLQIHKILWHNKRGK